MASIKKKSSGGGGANWMDTYGDMVTLLLCFFVLLYSISNIDQQKWMLIVQSFNKDAMVSTDEEPRGPEGDDGREGGSDMPMTQDDVETALDELYQYLAEYSAAQEAASVTVSKGDGYVFISFSDSVFFNPDSSVLREDGKAALDAIIPALVTAGPYVDELRILGHTAQATADRPNTPRGDRTLSAMRATEVLIYLQENIAPEELDPARMIAVGYGQHRPVASNDVPEERAKNRRVEMIITGRELENYLADSINQYYTQSGFENPEDTGTTDSAGAAAEGGETQDTGTTAQTAPSTPSQSGAAPETGTQAPETQSPLPEDEVQTQSPLPEDEVQTQSPLPEDEVQTQSPLPEDEVQTQSPLPEDEVETQSPLPEDEVEPQSPLPEATGTQSPLPEATGTQSPLP